MFSTRRVTIDSNVFIAPPGGNISEGGSITNSPLPPSTTHNAILRNRDVQQVDAYYRYETFTSDGGVGGYSGKALRSNGTHVTLAHALSPRPNSPISSGSNRPLDDDWAEAVMVVLGGTGAGQIVRIVSSKGDQLELEAPPTVALDGSSELTVVPNAGQSILAGNVWVNGTSVDYYGVALELVFADNTLLNMRSRPCPHCGDDKQLQDPIGGLTAHSLVYQSGQNAPSMPNMRVEILGNTLIDTNGITIMAANCGINNSLQVTPVVPTAPLTQGFVVRRNTLRRTQPCLFAPQLDLFGANHSRFYWNFAAPAKNTALCERCEGESAAACADNGINVIGCVRGGVVEGNVLDEGGRVNPNATNGSVTVLTLHNGLH